MKIGPFEFKWHKHEWSDEILAEYENEHGGYSVKLAKVCIAPACDLGYYKAVVWIECKSKPQVYKVDINQVN